MSFARPRLEIARRGIRRRILAVLAVLAGLLAVMVVALPAQAGPIDTNWQARRVGVNLPGPGDTLTSTPGDVAAATMTYNIDHAGGQPKAWDFTATATTTSADGTIRVPYTWQGLHAWFMVTARLDLLVNGNVVDTLVNAGPTSCCTTPSNGFLYGGVAEFDVRPGDTYGFRLSGSNGDSNDFLRGTFTLSTKPYIDATLGQDNRQWTGATELPSGGLDGKLVEPGEARWFKIPVVPGQRVAVDLTNLPADYDLALYGDIQAAFDRLTADPLSQQTLTQLSAGQASASAVTAAQLPTYDPLVTKIPDSPQDIAQSVDFAPRVYSPRVYSPRVYSPRVYSPRVYSPRVYSPDSYDPSLSGNQAFRDAFSGAQTQTLLAVSAKTGTGAEAVSAPTGNTQGSFYVRVQGHDDHVFSDSQQFHLARSISGGEACQDLQTYATTPSLGPTRNNATTVIVTDTTQFVYGPGTDAGRLTAALGRLAQATDGVVVDVAQSARVQELANQARRHNDCPYAMNLVANEIKRIVDQYRNDNSKYVVLAGNDDVVPFFRYPDLSGLGQESEFQDDSGVFDNNPSHGSLSNDQVLSQDAYGARTSLVVGGSTVPVPDLAVGRLVETPAEIEGTIDHSLEQAGSDANPTYTLRDLPRPTSSLVTGYDFLADAAHAVDTQFEGALGSGHAQDADELISEPGTPLTQSWHASDLRTKLLGSRHGLVYLAGHFSANDTLAADFDGDHTFLADELDPALFPDDAPLPLEDTLVLSAGCHSAYNTVDDVSAFGPDWAQRMAQQHAVLIGGTGYQYGDTDFLEYSERLYLQVARELRRGSAGTPVAVGSALVQAKQDYLASLATLTGIDEKAVLEATMYGLPMTGLDVAGRTGNGPDPADVNPVGVTTKPGSELGLATRDRHFTTTLTHHDKDSNAGAGRPALLEWYEGADGVTVQPGDPALPKQVEDVTAPGTVLRGVGFRGGVYEQESGVLPLTGAPAIEGTTPHSTFASERFYPQRMANVNYFDALGAQGSGGRTSLVLSPAQYRSDGGDVESDTDTVRAYSGMDLRLFYSGDTTTFTGGNQPAQALAPAITGVTGTEAGGQVTFAVHATGDPSAGVQQVWVTWTSGPDGTGRGTWASVDLSQDALDSTLWTGTLDLPAGVQRSDVRFLVQAANGVGVVGLDAAEGDGYRVTSAGVTDDVSMDLLLAATSTPSNPGITASVTDASGVGVAGRSVTFQVERGGDVVLTRTVESNGTGAAVLTWPSGVCVPSGRLSVTATLLSSDLTSVVNTEQRDVVMDGVTVVPTPPAFAARAGTSVAAGAIKVQLRDGCGAMPAGVPVTFTFPGADPSAKFGATRTVTVTTSGGATQGQATLPAFSLGTRVGTFMMAVTTDGAPPLDVTMGAQYGLSSFGSPVLTNGITSTTATGTTPIKVSALLANGAKLDDATAKGLVTAKRVELSWTKQGSSTVLGRNTSLWRYDASKDFFQADAKASTLGLQKKTTYVLTVRILAASANCKVDLGSRSFTLRVT